MNCLRIPKSASLVPAAESAALRRRVQARREWLRRRIQETADAEKARLASIKAAQERAIERWAEERQRPANVTSIEEARR